jgi:hypothetical protein
MSTQVTIEVLSNVGPYSLAIQTTWQSTLDMQTLSRSLIQRKLSTNAIIDSTVSQLWLFCAKMKIGVVYSLNLISKKSYNILEEKAINIIDIVAPLRKVVIS